MIDQTGLAGRYDMAFSYETNPDTDGTLSSLNVALKKATGLLLKPR